MKKAILIAAVLLVLAGFPAAALPPADLRVTTVTLDGYENLGGPMAGLELGPGQVMPEATFQGGGALIRVRTTNATNPSVGGVGVGRELGGDDRTYSGATLQAGAPGGDVAVVLVPLQGAPAPTIEARTTRLASAVSSTNELREVAYVDGARETLASDVGEVLQLETRGTSFVRVEGSFALSLWAWNFTLESAGQSVLYPTGSYREDPVRDPVTGAEITWTSHVQVAQVFVTDGWIEFNDEHGSAWTPFLPSVSIAGFGDLHLAGVTGTLGGKTGHLDHAVLEGGGAYTLVHEHADDGSNISLLSLEGALEADGIPLDLGRSGPIRGGSTQVAVGGPSWSRYFGPLAAVIGFMVVAALVKGPAQTVRFNRLQSRFDSRDYVGVLTRIEPFTRKRRYERKATFLKTVSLLSLQEYREAALYLETMGPREAPEPATKAFLQACAAAGLGQDDVAIQHLTTCLRLDPTYKDEVTAVPVLTGYLPYFDVNAGAPQ
jgi:hypothetical protein